MSVKTINIIKFQRKMLFLATRRLLPQSWPSSTIRFYSSCWTASPRAQPGSRGPLVDQADIERVCSEMSSINSRLANLSLMGDYYSSNKVLKLPTECPRVVHCPTTKTIDVKRFIVENPAEVKDPETVKKVIRDPVEKPVVRKHAIRMIVLRRRKMKKHQLKRLWERMYLKFRAYRVTREKTKELEFRGRLAGKVNQARQFNAEKYVEEYLSDYHTILTPKTYKGTIPPFNNRN